MYAVLHNIQRNEIEARIMADLFAPPTLEEVEKRRTKPVYKPAEVARILTEQFAHKVTAAVVRKWDNYILSSISPKEARAKGENRCYSRQDVEYFNLIAVLRNMGYSLDEIKEVLPSIGSIGPKNSFGIDVMNRIVRQREAFLKVQELLTRLSNFDFSKIVPSNSKGKGV